jgi:hypothetical protein
VLATPIFVSSAASQAARPGLMSHDKAAGPAEPIDD